MQFHQFHKISCVPYRPKNMNLNVFFTLSVVSYDQCVKYHNIQMLYYLPTRDAVAALFVIYTPPSVLFHRLRDTVSSVSRISPEHDTI